MNNQATWVVVIAMTLYSVSTLAQQEEARQDSETVDASESLSANGEAKTGEIRYVTDLIYTPIRTGPGGEYRIVNKGLPSGTQLTYFGSTEDGVWAEVETRGGTRGYLRAQYLQVSAPMANQVNALKKELEGTRERASQLQVQLDASNDELTIANEDRGTTAQDLETTKQELAEIKRISANAIQLDRLTNELTSKLEDANSRIDLLKLENARLEERVASRQRLEGIFAILVGIFLALMIPRLTVKHRRNDGWR
jgi:SH3 domain protein